MGMMFYKIFPTVRHSTAFGLLLMTAGVMYTFDIHAAGGMLLGGGIIWILLA